MLSRAQEARVLKVLGDCPSGTMRTYCLEHLLAATQIPSAQAFDLVAFTQVLQAKGECEAPTEATSMHPIEAGGRSGGFRHRLGPGD